MVATVHETYSSVGKLLQKYTVNYHNQHFYLWRFGLYQRPSSKEVWSILLPVRATVVMGWDGRSQLLFTTRTHQEMI